MFSLWKHSASMKFLEFVCENLLLLEVSKVYRNLTGNVYFHLVSQGGNQLFFCSVGGGGGGGGDHGVTMDLAPPQIWHPHAKYPRECGTPMQNLLGNLAPLMPKFLGVWNPTRNFGTS